MRPLPPGRDPLRGRRLLVAPGVPGRVPLLPPGRGDVLPLDRPGSASLRGGVRLGRPAVGQTIPNFYGGGRARRRPGPPAVAGGRVPGREAVAAYRRSARMHPHPVRAACATRPTSPVRRPLPSPLLLPASTISVFPFGSRWTDDGAARCTFHTSRLSAARRSYSTTRFCSLTSTRSSDRTSIRGWYDGGPILTGVRLLLPLLVQPDDARTGSGTDQRLSVRQPVSGQDVRLVPGERRRLLPVLVVLGDHVAVGDQHFPVRQRLESHRRSLQVPGDQDRSGTRRPARSAAGWFCSIIRTSPVRQDPAVERRRSTPGSSTAPSGPAPARRPSRSPTPARSSLTRQQPARGLRGVLERSQLGRSAGPMSHHFRHWSRAFSSASFPVPMLDPRRGLAGELHQVVLDLPDPAAGDDRDQADQVADRVRVPGGGQQSERPCGTSPPGRPPPSRPP